MCSVVLSYHSAADARFNVTGFMWTQAGLNPRRAFARVRAKLNQAQTTLQELESLRVDRTERLRQVYDNVKQRGLAAVAQKKSAGEEAALVGKDSIFRVGGRNQMLAFAAAYERPRATLLCREQLRAGAGVGGFWWCCQRLYEGALCDNGGRQGDFRGGVGSPGGTAAHHGV